MRWAAAKERLLRTVATFKNLSQYAWLPALVVSGVSAYYGYRNYHLQIAGSRPDLSYTQVTLSDPYSDQILHLQARNVGTRAATDFSLAVRTIDPATGVTKTLTSVVASNSIPREGQISANPKINVKELMGVLVLCTRYRDVAGTEFSDTRFYMFPGLNPNLTKEQGGGGSYDATDIPPDSQRSLEKFKVCAAG
jgi:hypothetical protein